MSFRLADLFRARRALLRSQGGLLALDSIAVLGFSTFMSAFKSASRSGFAPLPSLLLPASAKFVHLSRGCFDPTWGDGDLVEVDLSRFDAARMCPLCMFEAAIPSKWPSFLQDRPSLSLATPAPRPLGLRSWPLPVAALAAAGWASTVFVSPFLGSPWQPVHPSAGWIRIHLHELLNLPLDQDAEAALRSVLHQCTLRLERRLDAPTNGVSMLAHTRSVAAGVVASFPFHLHGDWVAGTVPGLLAAQFQTPRFRTVRTAPRTLTADELELAAALAASGVDPADVFALVDAL